MTRRSLLAFLGLLLAKPLGVLAAWNEQAFGAKSAADALKGIGGALGRGDGGGGFDDGDGDSWEPTEELTTPFDDTVLADPAHAAADAETEPKMPP